MRLPLLGLPLFFPCLLSAAQVQGHPIPHPGGMITGNASEVLVGRFNGDVIPDGFVLQDGDLLLIDSPDRISYFTKVEGTYTSICKVNLTSGQDGVLASSSAGLTLFDWYQGALRSTVVSTHTDWVAATKLQAIQRSGTSTKICGVAASGVKILYGEWSGSAFTAITGIGRDSTIKALAGLYWNAGNDLDFAYDLGAGVEVITDTGSSFGSQSQACSTPSLLRLPIQGYDDGVIWLTTNPSGGQRLFSLARVIGGSGIAVMQEIACAPNTVERMTLANFDTGTATDLVLSTSRTGGRFARVLYRVGPAYFGIFGNTGEPFGVELDLAPVAGTSCGLAPAVAAGDLDGDGDDDLLYAGHASCTASLRVFFGNGVDQERDSPAGTHIMPWLYDTKLPEEPPYTTFTIFPWESPTTGPAANATDIHVRVFTGDNYEVSSSTPLFDDFFPVDSEEPMVVPFAGSALPDPLYFEFSYATRSGDIVTSAFPAWIGTFDGGFPYGAIGKSTGGFDRPPRPPSGP